MDIEPTLDKDDGNVSLLAAGFLASWSEDYNILDPKPQPLNRCKSCFRLANARNKICGIMNFSSGGTSST